MPALRIEEPLTWNEGVFLLPVDELPDEVRAQLAPDAGDFAFTRPQGRNGSKLLDRDSAELVQRFVPPRTIVEAVVLFSRQRGEEPEQVLEGAFPLLKSLVASGYLVPSAKSSGAASQALTSHWAPGETLLGGEVVALLQVLEDSELYCLRRADRSFSVLKVERRRHGGAESAVRLQIRREAELLTRLGGSVAPRLLSAGEIDGRCFLEIEFLAAVELEREEEAVRQSGRAAVLALAVELTHVYAELHQRGVVHGDVHPRNVLVDRSGRPRLIDFGLATDASGSAEPVGRGGIAFYYEPELARAFLRGTSPPAASVAGEQYAVAVMLYRLATGHYPRDYSLGRDEMLGELAVLPPLTFAERGVAPWPELEALLTRALAKKTSDRFPSMAAFHEALRALLVPGSPTPSRVGEPPGGPLPALAITAADWGGDWEAAATLTAPRASLNYGEAGVALGLLTLAQAQGEGRPLALAGHWLRRAAIDLSSDEACYNPEIDITREVVGSASPYHSAAGIHAVAALLARARGDFGGQAQATERFLAASATGHQGLDLTLGKCSTLLGTAILLDALPMALVEAEAALRIRGYQLLGEIWEELEALPAVPEADIEYLGIAHGWAGFLYATLAWCEVAAMPLPSGVPRRLTELAALARPRGRGLVWPWTLSPHAQGATMPGWCNGSAGYVFLWTLAHRAFGDPRLLELARGAAWDSFDSPDGGVSLC